MDGISGKEMTPATMAYLLAGGGSIISALLLWLLKSLINNVKEQRDRLIIVETKVELAVADNRDLKDTVAGIHNSLAKYNSDTHKAILDLSVSMGEMNTNMAVIRERINNDKGR